MAGCCAKTTIAPLDRVKILLQAQNPHYKHLGETSAAKHGKPISLFSHIWATWVKLLIFRPFAGVIATIRAVPKKEGFLGLYKGNGAMMVRIFPYGAIQFMAFDNYKKVQYYTLYCGITPSKGIFFKRPFSIITFCYSWSEIQWHFSHFYTLFLLA